MERVAGIMAFRTGLKRVADGVCSKLGMTQVTIEVPDELAAAFGGTPEARQRRLTAVAAIEGYRSGALSRGQVGQMLGLGFWETEEFFRANHVPLNYGAADLEADLKTLGELSKGIA